MGISSIRRLEKLLKEDTLGEYEIGDLLGRGGMALVYIAEEVHLSRKVAIKVLPPELTFGHGVERFKREAKVAAGLDHPNIIPIYRIASGGNVFWYAMKFLEGQSLDDLLKDKSRCSLEETIRILIPVADALDYGHLHSVIHRDIKPANIMLDAQDRVIVTDFGIAKALTEGKITATGSVIGTPYYMSPEQGLGKPVTGAADQYSLAVMTYRMLSGQLPFQGDSAIDILHKHCTFPPPPVDVLCPGLPDYVYKAIDKGLAKEPAQRFSSVTAFVNALREPSPELAAAVTVGSESPTDVPTPSATQRLPPAVGKRRLLKVLIPLIVILTIGGVGAFLWWTTQRDGGAAAGGQIQAEQVNSPGGVSIPVESPQETQAESTAAEVAPIQPRTQQLTPPRPAAPQAGILRISVNVVANVSIASETFSSVRRVIDTIEANRPHTIRFRRDGYVPKDTIVTLQPGQTETIIIVLEAGS